VGVHGCPNTEILREKTSQGLLEETTGSSAWFWQISGG